MQHIASGYRTISLLINVNWDRITYPGTILIALLAGAFIGSL